MNPYLEQEDVWHVFHEQFCNRCFEALVSQVRPSYIVKIDHHVYIHEHAADERRLIGRGDVMVSASRGSPAPPGAPATATAPAYGRVPAAVDVERESFIEIRDRQDRQLVTVVELLSPANKKAGPDRDQYSAKRRQLFASGAHFVEIDLLRGWQRLPIEDLPDCDYYALVSQVEERPRVGLWPLRLRDPLPEIPVPLRAPDPSARLDLQRILQEAYDAGGYEDYVYTGSPQPPLHPQDAGWARGLIPKQT